MRQLQALIVVLLAVHAAALKVTVAGQTYEVNPLNPSLPLKPGGGRPGGSFVPTIVDALCPLTGPTNVQISPFPIKSEDVCGSFGLNAANNAYACLALGQILPILGNPPLRCAPDAIPAHPNTDPNGRCCSDRCSHCTRHAASAAQTLAHHFAIMQQQQQELFVANSNMSNSNSSRSTQRQKWPTHAFWTHGVASCKA
jgi:hypothetical protein